MRELLIAAVMLLPLAATSAGQYRTLDDRFPPPPATTRAGWNIALRGSVSTYSRPRDCLPLPTRTPLHANIFDESRHPGYRVSKVYFESLPGFYVTGNLYQPEGDGPFPAVLSAHGHWTYGRLEHSALRLWPGSRHQSRAPGIRRVHLRHDRLQRQPPVGAHVRAAAASISGGSALRACNSGTVSAVSISSNRCLRCARMPLA